MPSRLSSTRQRDSQADLSNAPPPPKKEKGSMNKSFIALAALATSAGLAQAQSAVTVYGNIDLGVFKKTGSTLSEGRRDNNRLGFKGVEDLGDGLKALFQLEIRYDPDV